MDDLHIIASPLTSKTKLFNLHTLHSIGAEMHSSLLKVLTIVLIAIGTVMLLSSNARSESNVNTDEMRKASTLSKFFALEARQGSVDKGYKAFKDTVYKEPFPGGVYIVNGDTPIVSEQALELFYRNEINLEWKTFRFGTELIIDAPGGKDAGWDSVASKNLTYCVSKNFGSRYPLVVNALVSATAAWEEAASVKFKHVESFDGQCDGSTSGVVFDVRPVSGQPYLARAFFPRESRPTQNLLINNSSFNLDPNSKLTLEGILRHELGHALGFRHEHTRPEAGECFEDKSWVPLTSYDAFSVMHYPQCKGLGDWSLKLTEKDMLGAACRYGPGSKFKLNPADCKAGVKVM